MPCGGSEDLFASPMRLEQHAVDLLELDGFCSVADGLKQACDAEVSRILRSTEGVLRHERERVGYKDFVRECDAVGLAEDEALHVVGRELVDESEEGDYSGNSQVASLIRWLIRSSVPSTSTTL